MDEVLETLEYEVSIRPNHESGLDPYIQDFSVVVKAWDDEEAETITIGKVTGHRIDLASARVDKIEFSELLESVSPQISDFREKVLQDDECFLPVHAANEQQERCECLVYIDEITVQPEYRGQQIGTQLFRHIGQMLNMENCLIGLFAFPIASQPGEKRSIIDINRVKNFYQKLGFLHAGHEFMVKNARNCEAVRKRLAYRNLPLHPG
jgi:GNAT superfamily N-acetyltransferase